MNKITSTASVTQVLPDNAAATGAESSSGAAGAFSQLLGQFSAAAEMSAAASAAATATLDDATATAGTDGINGATPPSTPLSGSAENPKLTGTDDVNDVPAADPSLVAALLVQMQAPYAMLTPAQPAPATADDLPGMNASPDGVTPADIRVTAPPMDDGSPMNIASPTPSDVAFDSAELLAPELPQRQVAADTSPSTRAGTATLASLTSADNGTLGIPASSTTNAAALAADKAARPAVIDPVTAAALAQSATGTGLSSLAQTSLASGNEPSNTATDDPESLDTAAATSDLARAHRTPPFTPPLAAPDSRTGASPIPSGMTPPAIATALMDNETQVSVFIDKIDKPTETSPTAFAVPTASVKAVEVAPQITIAADFGSPEWKPAFVSGVKVLVDDGITAATIQLNPAEFGPIDVRIVMTDKRADVSFLVTNADANAALQSALPELREQLARGGIQLGQTSVGAHAQDPRQPSDTSRRQGRSKPDTLEATRSALPAGALNSRRNTSQIDTFA